MRLECEQRSRVRQHVDRAVDLFAARFPNEVEAMCQALEKDIAHGRRARLTPAEQLAGDHLNQILSELAKGERYVYDED
jgi:hypothetical protein